jgi:hypothetical protein
LFTQNVPWARHSFWTHPIELLGDVGHGESCFGPFRVGVSVGARKVLEIILEEVDELLGDVAHVESCFSPFSDGVSVKAG